MMEHLLIHSNPHLGGKADYSQNQIYYLNIIPGEDIASFINRCALLQKNITIPNQAVSSNILFDKVLTHIIACKGFPPFLVTKYSSFLLFHKAHGCSSSLTDEPPPPLYDYLETSKDPLTITLSSTPTTNHTSQLDTRISMITFQNPSPDSQL